MTRNAFLDAFDQLGDALGGAGDSVLTLPIGLIDEDPDNPRRSFDEAEIAALAETMKSIGLLQPITVRPAGPDGRYRLRFGARRLRAARIAGLQEVRALVRSGALGEADAVTEQLIENDQRANLNTQELAGAVARLLELGLTQTEVGRRLGRPKDQIAMLAAVRTMPPELQTLAQTMGVRALYELGQAWKADPKRTRQWLADRDPGAITQAQARDLALDARPALAASNPDANVATNGSIARGERERRRPRTSGRPGTSSPAALTFEVTLKGKPGRLLLDAISEPAEQARVELEDGRTLLAPLSQIKLVRLKPAP